MAQEDFENQDGNDYEGEVPPPFAAGEDLDLYLAGRANGEAIRAEDLSEGVGHDLDEDERRVLELFEVMHEEMARVAPALELRREEPEPDFDPTELLDGHFDGLYPQESLRGMHVIGTEHPLITPPRGVQRRDVRRMTGKIAARHFAQRDFTQGEKDAQ